MEIPNIRSKDSIRNSDVMTQRSSNRLGFLFVSALALWASVPVFWHGDKDDTHEAKKIAAQSPVSRGPAHSNLPLLPWSSVEVLQPGKAVAALAATTAPATLKSLVLKPLLIELASLALFQFVGVPLLSRLALAVRKLRRWRITSTTTTRCRSVLDRILPMRWRILFRHMGRTARRGRRVRQTLARAYRKRHRLSVATEVTNLIPEAPKDDPPLKEANA